MSRDREAIPLLDLTALHAPIQDRIDAALARVAASGLYVNGPDVASFEADFATLCGVPHAVGCSSGTDALVLALQALGVGAGDQVICPAFSFFATASAIVRVGATPLFADIEPRSFNIDVEHAAALAEGASRLRAILPVHLFGTLCDLDPLLALCERHAAALVEDAAQAVDAHDARGRKAGSRADIAAFSLYPTKNLGALGDAGITTTASPRLADALRRLREHGSTRPYEHAEVGLNARLDTLQAAVLSIKLERLPDWTRARIRNAERYAEAFAALGAARSLAELRESKLPVLPPLLADAPAQSVHHQYAIRVPAEHRDGLRAHLAEERIASAIYYPGGLHEQACLLPPGAPVPRLPQTEAACREVLALPVHPTLSTEQIERVARAIDDYFAAHRSNG